MPGHPSNSHFGAAGRGATITSSLAGQSDHRTSAQATEIHLTGPQAADNLVRQRPNFRARCRPLLSLGSIRLGCEVQPRSLAVSREGTATRDSRGSEGCIATAPNISTCGFMLADTCRFMAHATVSARSGGTELPTCN